MVFVVCNCVLLLLSLFTTVYGAERRVTCSIFPSSNSSSAQVMHVSAVGEKDVIHFLWSTYKLPSIIVARTSNDTEINIDLKKLESFTANAISFSESPLASIGFTISELIQLTYKDDTASVRDVVNTTRLGLDSFKWSRVTHEQFQCSKKSASITLKANGENDIFSQNGTFELQFSMFGNKESATNFPHLIYTGNNTQIQIMMDNLYSETSRTRYSLETVMLSSTSIACSDTKCQSFSSRSISDEFSPGIFSDIDLLPQCVPKNSERGSFFTWRPVAYVSPEPSVANSSDVTVTSDCNSTVPVDIRSIAALYFAGVKNSTSDTFALTFGTAGDGFYPKTKYTSWSLMVGTGVPVHTSLSMSAIIFMSVGLGALALFFLTGGIFIAVRWCRTKDDDLLLGTYVN